MLAESGSRGSRRAAGGGARGPSRWRRGPVSIAARAAAAPLTPPGLRGAAHGHGSAAPPPAAQMNRGAAPSASIVERRADGIKSASRR
jgi:hypothetical protein